VAFGVSIDPVGLIRRIPLKPHQLKSRITDNEDLFLLAHLGIPNIAPNNWRLEVTGLVKTPMTFGLKELQEFPKVEVESVHECAGNPLEPLIPKRRVGNVVWGGVPLSEIFKVVGIQDTAKFVWSFGADHGTFNGDPVPEYGKDLPLDGLDAGDVLIAYELNGEPLPRKFGAPARLFVPGFYGTNSVKWLTRIELADRRYVGLFTTKYYNEPIAGKGGDGPGKTRPVWKIAPEAIFVSPSPSSDVSGRIRIVGWAWGFEEIASVEISSDEGRSWQEAELAPRKQWSWQQFEYFWEPLSLGPATLLCRATNVAGETQPESGARNAIHTVNVNVVEAAQPTVKAQNAKTQSKFNRED